MRKILLIDAHPDSDRLTSSLVSAKKRPSAPLLFYANP